MPFTGENRPGASFNKSKESAERFHAAAPPTAGAGFAGNLDVVIKDQNIAAIIVLLFVCVVLGVLSAVFTVQLYADMQKGTALKAQYLLLFLPLVELLCLAFLVRAILQRRKYGVSELRWASAAPPRVGSVFRGALFTTNDVPAQSEFVFSISCTRTKSSGSGKNRRSHSQTVFNQDSKVPAGGVRSRSGVPFEFNLPTTCEPSKREHNVQISWSLNVKAKTGGVDFGASFPIHVGGVGDNSADPDE